MIYQILIKSDNKLIKRFAMEIAAFIGLTSSGLIDEIIIDKPGKYPYIELDFGKLNLEKNKRNYKLSVNEEDYMEAIFLIGENIFNYNLKSVPEFIEKSSPQDSFFKESGLIKEDQLFKREAIFNVFVDDLDFNMLKIAGLYTARFFMDVNFIHFPIFTKNKDKSNIIFEKSNENAIYIDEKTIIKYFDDDFFKTILLNRNLEKTNFIKDQVFNKNSFEYQFIKAASISNKIYIENMPLYMKKDLPINFPNIKIHSYKDKKSVKEYNYEYPWEIDIFNDKVDKISKNKKIKELKANLSEPQNIRRGLINKLKENPNLKDANIEIYNSFKQGFSWIEDFVIEKIRNLDIDKIEIAWTAFQKEDETWTNESGAIPSYTNIGVDNHGKWYDLPIRLLQELYPIDDLIEKEIGLSRDNIDFPLETGDFSYHFRAYNNNKLVFNEKYDAVFSERNYLDSYPGMGLVHPSTGFIKAIFEDGSIYEKKFNTDLENIWEDYQKVLKDIGENILEKNWSSENQPFFGELCMNIKISEEDRKLNIREDIISSIDSFHEDLYFVGLDYFKVLGEQNNKGIFDSPGLILPEIHNIEGPPSFSIELKDFIDSKPFTILNDKKVYLDLNNNANIKGFTEKNEKIYLILDIDLNEEEIYIFEKLLKIGLSKFSELDIAGLIINGNILEMGETSYIDGKIPNIENKVINHKNNEILLNNIKKKAEISHIGQSFLGREIRSMDFIKDRNLFESHYKSIENRPTLYINGRHHANEVSSTNSSFILANIILKDKSILDKLNIIILPMENPDGTEIHYQLMKEHPNWIFHVARFNALGKEFGHEYFKKDSIHSEAKALEHIFYRYLPDIYIDDHGVPTHEWNQQFSGYTSPSYKGFWLPRSLLYGYFWYPKGNEWDKNIEYAEEIQDAIADGINSDNEMRNLNLEWKNRFEKYAHSWLPNMFPTGYYKDMIFYWIPFEADRNHHYLSIRYPEIVIVGYTSEVTDETAQGSSLELASRAHLENNLAIINLISSKEIVFDKYMERHKEKIIVYKKRRRND